MVQNSVCHVLICARVSVTGLLLERVQPGMSCWEPGVCELRWRSGSPSGKLGSYMKEGGERGGKFKERRVKSLSCLRG